MADFDAVYVLAMSEEARQMGHGEFFEQGQDVVGVDKSHDRDFQDVDRMQDIDGYER